MLALVRRARVHRVLWQLTKGTSITAFKYRITGLAAEAAFWALLSLPPLILGLISSAGYLRGAFGESTVNELSLWIKNKSGTFLTQDAVNNVVAPMVDEVLNKKHIEILSLGFLISLWAGSRALSVYVDTISIAYGLDGVRGVIRARLKSFFLYIVGLLVAVVVIPMLIAGPQLVRAWIPGSAHFVSMLYWPVVVTLSIFFLSLLYHLSVPVRTAWWRETPGAVLALVFWIAGSVILREYLSGTVSGVSATASLAAPIAVMAWLYVTAFAVLVGACLNAEIDRLWPAGETSAARAKAQLECQVKNLG
ncbi:YihY/virulence factor BrkB family protein [Actinocorallia longicatena]|uniref:YihY/virulence factor BrkB family protein n=1 Tax=Actinocorallia longicatena TaxID=111803 RepID=A0ABP6QFM1_9ACTN